jgi:ribosome recycling factor
MSDAKRRMEGAVTALTTDFATVRTGRASTSLLDRVTVDAYGTRMPLNQLAGVTAPEPRLITVQPYDRGLLGAIERAIQESDLGLNPGNDGQIVRLQLPEMTEERRREMVKVARSIAEEGRIAIRNIRRDTMHDLRELKDAGEAGADDEKRAEEALQKATDEKIAELDAALKAKEAEILEV